MGADDGLCKVFSTVGKHTIGQLEASGIFNGTIALPKVPEALRPLIKVEIGSAFPTDTIHV